MSLPIEDYGLIGDLQTAGLVGSNGSVDWLCLPRFDSPACFASLLGTEENGYWRIAPQGEVRRTARRYRGPTLVLETDFETADGVVRLVDCMPVRERYPRVVRIVEGVRGTVLMKMSLQVRFDYGRVKPWVERVGHRITGTAGPDALELSYDVPLVREGAPGVVYFEVAEGQKAQFVLSWHPSHEPAPAPNNGVRMIEGTEAWWRTWASRSTYHGEWHDEVMRSLITLKALIYEPTGASSLPPQPRCPSFLAACGTGIIASAGSATLR